MYQNTPELDLFFYKLKKLVKELNQVLTLMIEDRINNMLNIVFLPVHNLIHAGSSSDD